MPERVIGCRRYIEATIIRLISGINPPASLVVRAFKAIKTCTRAESLHNRAHFVSLFATPERGHHAINGDTELAYQGDPATGESLEGRAHEHHIWDVDKVRALAADRSHAATFFCGGSRNFDRFIDVFDRVFVLELDVGTLNRRLAARPQAEWGSKPAEQRLIRRLHEKREDLPQDAIPIDAAAPVSQVVDAILRGCS